MFLGYCWRRETFGNQWLKVERNFDFLSLPHYPREKILSQNKGRSIPRWEWLLQVTVHVCRRCWNHQPELFFRKVTRRGNQDHSSWKWFQVKAALGQHFGGMLRPCTLQSIFFDVYICLHFSGHARPLQRSFWESRGADCDRRGHRNAESGATKPIFGRKQASKHQRHWIRAYVQTFCHENSQNLIRNHYKSSQMTYTPSKDRKESLRKVPGSYLLSQAQKGEAPAEKTQRVAFDRGILVETKRKKRKKTRITSWRVCLVLFADSFEDLLINIHLLSCTYSTYILVSTPWRCHLWTMPTLFPIASLIDDQWKGYQATGPTEKDYVLELVCSWQNH